MHPVPPPSDARAGEAQRPFTALPYGAPHSRYGRGVAVARRAIRPPFWAEIGRSTGLLGSVHPRARSTDQRGEPHLLRGAGSGDLLRRGPPGLGALIAVGADHLR